MKVLSPPMRFALAVASMALLQLACRDSTTPGGNNNNSGKDAGTNMGLECPGEGQTVCAIKLASSARHPMIGEPVSLAGVVVTSATIAVSKAMDGTVTLAGFYVQDPAGADFLDRRYSGVAVVYNPMELVGRVPVVGTKISIEGVYAEFGQMGFDQQKQVRAARIDSTSELVAIEPAVISSANLIARGGADAMAYEGVLVRVDSVTVNAIDLMVNGRQLFGAFRVDGDLIVSGQFFEYRGAVVGEVFSQIAGVLRLGTAPFDAGEMLLSPRAAAEIVSQTPRVVIDSIDGINNASSPKYVRDICTQDRNSGFSCPKVELRHVLVTAVDGYVSENLRALWVQDANDADGLFAGIKVVYNPMRTANVPAVGNYVDIDGEVLSYYNNRQVQYPTITILSDMGTPTPRVIQPDQIAQRATSALQYMGSLVRIEGVSVTDRCLEGSNGDDFGGWLVTGGVQIGTAFPYAYHGTSRPMGTVCQNDMRMPTGACVCEGPMVVPRTGDMRRDGDMFQSITGIVDNTFDANQLVPRGDGDIVRQ